MKKPLRKKNRRSVHHTTRALFKHHPRQPADECAEHPDALESRIAQFMASLTQEKPTHVDGYWSVLREL